ncbi:hypothetical protein CFP56_035477 [Quercus suber]|uniref:Uncharacterized protein n=1 Tax=Quercus suber TaxID=58331 RepID=A0AAW0LQY4_QUESU
MPWRRSSPSTVWRLSQVPRFIVPMKNGDLDSKGLLASIIQAEGTIESFKELLSKEMPDVQVLEPTPGIPLEVQSPSYLP